MTKTCGSAATIPRVPSSSSSCSKTPNGVAIEVAHARPFGVFEQLDEEEGTLGIVAAEPQVLVIAADLLAVQVDVEQLPRVERLGDGVGKVQPRHPLVRDFGVDADHVRMIERINEGEHVAGGR